MAEAYVLAGELRRCGGDHVAAFARYEDRMMPFLRSKQASAAGFASSFAPKSAFGIAFRNLVTRLLRSPSLAKFLFGRLLRDDIELPDYGSSPTVGPDHAAPSSPPAGPGGAAERGRATQSPS